MALPLRRTLVVLVLLLGAALRFAWPLTDPPAGLSWSTAVYTDPASKTLPALYAARFGDWHLSEGQYLRAFPLANGLAWAAYRTLGVGRQAQQILAGALATAGLVATMLLARRTLGSSAGLLGAALAATSWWLVMFGRVPVVENLVSAMLAFSAWFALGRGRAALVIAGVLAATAALFGKYHAAAFLPVLAGFLVARHSGWRAAWPAALGGAAVFVVWLFAVYVPFRSEVLAYIGRESVGLHGALPITESPWRGLLGLFTSARQAWVFHQTPLVAGLGLVFALRTVTDRGLWRERLHDGTALFALWFLGMWAYFALLSYKAPRYYVTVGIPLVVCAAAQLTAWFRAGSVTLRAPTLRRVPAHFLLAFAAAFAAVEVVRQLSPAIRIFERTRADGGRTALYDALAPVDRALTGTDGHLLWALGVAVVATAAWWMLARNRPTFAARPAAVVLVAVVLVLDGGRLVHWSTHRHAVLEQIKASLPTMIAPDSVLLGPMAAVLTQDSGLLAASWLAPVGASAASLVPRVTHRITDDQSAARDAQGDLPGRLVEAEAIQSWTFPTRYVRHIGLARVETADNQRTEFERAAHAMHEQRWNDALVLLQQHRERVGETPELLFKEATCLYSVGDARETRKRTERVVRLRPEDAGALRNLGLLAYQSGETAAARAYWRRGLRADPYNEDLLDVLRRDAAEGKP